MLKNLGGINIETKKYELPKYASKQNKYKCPDCSEKIIFKKGQIKAPHFSHYRNSNCDYYEKPSESKIHKSAKGMLKNLIENNKTINILKNCNYCKENSTININKYNKLEHEIKLEYSSTHNDSPIFIDVAFINKNKNENEIKYIFEIYCTNKTKEEKRPEPWFELDARNLLELNTDTDITIKCLREHTCENCNLKKIYFKYLRYFFHKIENYKYEKIKSKNLLYFYHNESDLYFYIKYTIRNNNNYKITKDNYIRNKYIISLFKNLYNNINIEIKCEKGYIIINLDKKYINYKLCKESYNKNLNNTKDISNKKSYDKIKQILLDIYNLENNEKICKLNIKRTKKEKKKKLLIFKKWKEYIIKENINKKKKKLLLRIIKDEMKIIKRWKVNIIKYKQTNIQINSLKKIIEKLNNCERFRICYWIIFAKKKRYDKWKNEYHRIKYFQKINNNLNKEIIATAGEHKNKHYNSKYCNKCSIYLKYKNNLCEYCNKIICKGCNQDIEEGVKCSCIYASFFKIL